MACSTTPRSGRRLVEELACDDGHDLYEQIYEEAKLALVHHDTATASQLFDACPPSYKNTQRYRKQCKVFRDLCRSGVLQRQQTSVLRETIAGIVHEDTNSAVVIKYAELLCDQGYTAATLDSMTLNDLAHFFSQINFPSGYQTLFERHFERRSSCLTRFLFHTLRIVERCGGAQACVKLARGATKGGTDTKGSVQKPEGEDEEECESTAA